MENEEKVEQPEQKEKQRVDIDAKTSSESGLVGLFETLLRRFRNVVPAAILGVLYLLGCFCMGLSILPAVYFFVFIRDLTQSWPQFWNYLALSCTLAMCYFIYGFTLLFVLPTINFILPLRLKPWRGIYFSIKTVPWYFHNALTYLARYTFLKFVTPSPFSVMFYRMMGMKVGRGAQINSVNISDPGLMELGDKVTIGGSATLICHYAAGGFLILAPVRIGKGATVGIKSTVMGGVEIGEYAKVLPNSVVMPKTVIPAGEIWGGVPAEFIRKSAKK